MSQHEFGPLVARLREVAREAARGGPMAQPAPHPDAELVELCARVLDLRAEADAFSREARKMHNPIMGNPAFEAELKKRNACDNACRSPMARISKFEAKTPVGIYAKAHVLRTSHGHAPSLALSLAYDLTTCPGLRAILWPATEGA
jgi:hypothetical protein